MRNRHPHLLSRFSAGEEQGQPQIPFFLRYSELQRRMKSLRIQTCKCPKDQNLNYSHLYFIKLITLLFASLQVGKENGTSWICFCDQIIQAQFYKRMKKVNKQPEDVELSAFSIYYQHQTDPQYPLLLATALHKTQNQLEVSRAMKMLGDWVSEYEQMSQVIKYKYFPYIGKIQKILIAKYEQKASIEYCLSRFFSCFFHSWKEFGALLAEKLRASDSYSLSFLWYTSQILVTDMQLAKLQQFLQFLTTNYEEPLRFFDPESYADARNILQIVYLINVHSCRDNFFLHANNWALKMRLFEEAGSKQTQIELNMAIIRNRNLLIVQQKSSQYWLNKVSTFLQFLQQILPKMMETSPLNIQIIKLFEWLIELPEVKELLLQSEGRYMRSLVNIIKPNPNEPNYIFNNPKYSEIGNSLYQLFFTVDLAKIQYRVKDLLQKFINHAFSILNDEKTYAFLECYSEKEITLEASLVTDILKLLNSSHIRRTLSAKVILILAKLIDATINTCPFTDEMITICLKAFSQSLLQKSIDPLIHDLRTKVAKLFLHLMQQYFWQDNNKSEMVFILCDDFEKNSKFTNPVVLELLSILVKKFAFAIHSLHKLEPLIIQIHLKIIYDEANMHQFISLLIIIYFSTKWEKATQLIESVCNKNSSPLAPFYSFQAQILIKSNSSSSEDEMEIVSSILETKENWQNTRIKVNLILLEMYFLRLNSSEAFKVLRKVDAKILNLIKQFYEDGHYHLLAQLVAKTLPAAGGAANLQKLESYNWIRNFSFEILARSFYKSTSIYICYIFSSIILRADHQGITIRWLCQQQFLDYLYQGLNDFLSKQKKISLELVTTILVFKLLKLDPSLIPSESRVSEFTTIIKNVGWWDDMGNKIYFSLLEDNAKSSWLLPEFQRYYQEAIIDFFKNYERSYKQRKILHLRQMENLSQNQQDI